MKTTALKTRILTALAFLVFGCALLVPSLQAAAAPPTPFHTPSLFPSGSSGGNSGGSSIPIGCPGGPPGPKSPGTKCPSNSSNGSGGGSGSSSGGSGGSTGSTGNGGNGSTGNGGNGSTGSTGNGGNGSTGSTGNGGNNGGCTLSNGQCASCYGNNCVDCSKTACTDSAIECSQGNCDLINTYINPAIKVLSIIVGIVVVLSIILGGVQYSTSEGDPQKAANAKSRITKTVLALVAYLFLYAFLQFLIPGGAFNR